jgi:Glycosyl hydrolase 2 galactose-binding domain-like/Exo-beta-D-glucosaminidase Ig-fold domain/Glycosyl hydrolases family 2/F5/8 type C domain
MPSSRRKFLKSAVGTAGVAFGDLGKLALPSSKFASTAEPPVGLTGPLAGSSNNASAYTRGIGVYPGDPNEYFGPSLVADSSTYRNLALHRPAYHSSSYDYNLTAQLVTDGIKHTHLPDWVATSVSVRGQLPKIEREFILDHNPTSVVDLRGPRPWVQIQLGGGESIPQVDRIEVLLIPPRELKPENLTITVSVSDDGREWTKGGSVTAPEPIPLGGYPMGFAHPGHLFQPSIPLSPTAQSRFYRVELEAANAPPFAFFMQWQVGEVAFLHQNQRVEIGGPYNFTSAWMSAGLGEEWVYVDLAARVEFDHVALHWIARAAEGTIQVSDDAQNWRDLQDLPVSTHTVDEIKLAPGVQGRYVRVLMTRPTSQYGYILSEFEVYGRGGFVAHPKPAPAAQTSSRLDLAGGAWRLQRDSLVTADGNTLSKPGFKDDDWVVATVPGTVLTSYLNIGAIPDPNYGDNQFFISDSFFYADFWYRNEFATPPVPAVYRTWLNFDGINWMADVFLNGQKLGRIEGGFMRGRFDVTELLRWGQKNVLAVRVEKNATPGSVKQKTYETTGKNGGALGLDNPTYHASIGWDWIPTIRGRNTGILDDVYLTITGSVTLEEMFVTTTLPLPDTSRADVSVEVDVINLDSKPVNGRLRGQIGDVPFEQLVSIAAFAKKRIKMDPSSNPALQLQNPKLWWPTGFGEPYMYDFELGFETTDKKVPDVKYLRIGIRQMTYSEEGGALRIFINGRRMVPRGGNWGFSESMLRYGAREYDAAVRYHKEMNFTMIRNWVGQVGDEAFYQACDRHGVMVWQDFWLANPWDGPEPKDNDLFLRNVEDLVVRIRNHPSIGLYCGRNEGNPPKPLEDGIRKTLEKKHPGIMYIPNSASGPVGGGGPYMAMPPSFYFTAGSATKLHSEMGMPNIPTIESVRAMMPERALWPQSLDWGLHDFTLQGAQGGAGFLNMIETNYGGANNADDWILLSQFLNYEGYRAMFEGQSKNRMGLLLWMSHPCWPSFVWQTYDYYLEPTAAYFGCKKACEPLHIQWNPVSEMIEVVNYSAGDVPGLTARVEVLNMNGTKTWEQSTTLESKEDSVTSPIKMDYPAGLTSVHFLRLTLMRGGGTISTNFYMRGREDGNYRALRELPKVNLEATTRMEQQGQRWTLTTNLHNASNQPTLAVRLKAVREKSSDRILPVIYDDNYIALMPGERRTIRTELADADTRGEKPRMVVEGFNVGRVRES